MGNEPPSVEQVDAVTAQIQPSSATTFVSSEVAGQGKNVTISQTALYINQWSAIAEHAFNHLTAALSSANAATAGINVGTAGPPFESINVTAQQLIESSQVIHDNIRSNGQAVTNLRDLLRTALNQIQQQAQSHH